MNYAEGVLMSHLTTVESVEYLVREGFTNELTLEIIPTELIRRILGWTIDYYFESKRTVAPTKEAILASWGEAMNSGDEDSRITLDDEEETDSVQWCVKELRSSYARYSSDVFTEEMTKAVHTADKIDLDRVLFEQSERLHAITQSLVSRADEQEGHEGVASALERHKERAESGLTIRGLTFGMPEIDEFIYGVHPKEICTFAAATGGGKSWWAINCVLAEWKAGRRTILMTLENDLEMTYDRFACAAAHVDYGRWQQGLATEPEIERVMHFIGELEKSDHKPLIIEPRSHERSPDALVRRALIEDADSLIVDQLTFVGRAATTAKTAREDTVIGEKMRRFKDLIGDASKPIPLLMLHQINREGVAKAQKTGRYEPSHMAGGAEVERISSFLFTLYQTDDHKIAERAELQMIKSRRTKLNNWELTWNVGIGDVSVRREIGFGN